MPTKFARSRNLLFRPFRIAVGERMLAYSTLDPSLKRAIWLGCAVLLANILFIIFRSHVEGPPLEFVTGMKFGAGIAVICAILLLLALTVFTTGLSLSTTFLRWLFVGSLALIYIIPLGRFLSREAEVWEAVTVAAVSATPFLFLVFTFTQARHLRLLFLSASFAMAFVAIAVAAVAIVPITLGKGLPEMMFGILAVLILLAYPMFYLAGADFAELSDSLIHGVRRSIGRRVSTWIYVVLIIGLGMIAMYPYAEFAIAYTARWSYKLSLIAYGSVPVIAAVLLAAVLKCKTQKPVHRVPLASIVMVTIGLTIVTTIVDQARIVRPPPYFSGVAEPSFSVIMPKGWTGRRDEHKAAAIPIAFFKKEKALPFVRIFSLGSQIEQTIVRLNDLLPDGSKLPATPMPAFEAANEQGWQRFAARINYKKGKTNVDDPLVVVGWRKQAARSRIGAQPDRWYIIGVTRASSLGRDERDFEKFGKNFSERTRMQSDPAARMVLSIALGLIAVASLFAIYVLNLTPTRMVSLGFAGIASAFAAAHCWGGPVTMPLLGVLAWDYAMLWSVAFVTAVISICWAVQIAFSARSGQRPIVPVLFDLNVSILAAAALFFAFRSMSSLGNEYDFVKAIVALLTIAWDFFLVGGAITNGSSKTFPRAARVLMHLGFAQIVALAVFVWFPWEIRQTAVKGFDAEMLIATGIVNFGVPLVLTVAAIRVANLSRCVTSRRDSAEENGEEAEPA